MFGPRPVQGGSIVASSTTSAGNEIHLPVVRAGSVKLPLLRFDSSESPGLFGNRDDLIREWHDRLGMTIEAGWGTAATPVTGVSGRPGL